jgi:hypothetical protein
MVSWIWVENVDVLLGNRWYLELKVVWFMLYSWISLQIVWFFHGLSTYYLQICMNYVTHCCTMFNYSGSFLYASVMLHHGWFEDCIMDMFKYAQYISIYFIAAVSIYIYIYTVYIYLYIYIHRERKISRFEDSLSRFEDLFCLCLSVGKPCRIERRKTWYIVWLG